MVRIFSRMTDFAGWRMAGLDHVPNAHMEHFLGSSYHEVCSTRREVRLKTTDRWKLTQRRKFKQMPASSRKQGVSKRLAVGHCCGAHLAPTAVWGFVNDDTKKLELWSSRTRKKWQRQSYVFPKAYQDNQTQHKNNSRCVIQQLSQRTRRYMSWY